MREKQEIKSHYEFVRRYFPTTWAGWQKENFRRKTLGMPRITLEEFEKEKWTRWIP